MIDIIQMVVGGMTWIILGIPYKGGGSVCKGWADCLRSGIGF